MTGTDAVLLALTRRAWEEHSVIPDIGRTPRRRDASMDEATNPVERLDLMQHWCRWLRQRLIQGGSVRWFRALPSLLVVLALGGPALASPSLASQWSCDGDPLSISLTPGAVDLRGLPAGVPNTESNTAPGDGVLIQWRGQTLQLPRTNNAGPPSYTDGRWWWRALDPEHPEWKERRGRIISYACTAMAGEP